MKHIEPEIGTNVEKVLHNMYINVIKKDESSTCNLNGVRIVMFSNDIWETLIKKPKDE